MAAGDRQRKSPKRIKGPSKSRHSKYAKPSQSTTKGKKRSLKRSASKRHRSQWSQSLNQIGFMLQQLWKQTLRITLLMALGFALVFVGRFVIEALSQSAYGDIFEQLQRRFADEDIPTAKQKEYTPISDREPSSKVNPGAPHTQNLKQERADRKPIDVSELKKSKPQIRRDDTPQKRRSIQDLNSLVDKVAPQ